MLKNFKIATLSLQIRIFVSMIILIIVASAILATISIFQFKSEAKEYHQENPNDPPEGTLSHWDQFENKHPTTFIGMYQFWTKPDKSTYDTNNF